MEAVKGFLLNAQFIFMPIIFAHFLFFRGIYIEGSPKKRSNVFTITSIISIILCMSFPVQLGDFIFDLHLIPLLLGILYGGKKGGFIVVGVLVFYRFLLGGGIGAYITIFETLFVLLFALPLVKKIRSSNVIQRIVYSSLICISPLIIGYNISLFIMDEPPHLLILGLCFTTVLTLTMIFIIIDIMSERYKYFNAVRKSEKLEVVSQLAASISHEVRNPLTVTKGFLQLLDGDEEDLKKKRYIELALNQLNDAEVIISDYLTFAKPEGSDVTNGTTINLSKEISYVLSILRPLANHHSVSVNSQIISVNINGEVNKFRQCFINILKNCLEAMPDGGTLDLRTYLIGDKVFVKIMDSGVGMTEEQVKRLGEPYFSTKTKGTGLGMMVSFSVIRSLGGSINVESVENEGTTFVIGFRYQAYIDELA